MAIPTLADLVTTSRKTSGDVPPPMVGSSSTVIGSTLYIFGGRPVTSEQPTARLYALELASEQLEWKLLSSSSTADGSSPSPRYLHSATAWEGKLVIHGGEGPTADEGGGMRELGDLAIFDPSTRRWSSPSLSCAPSVEAPEPCCAHLAFFDSFKSHLHIVGGQSAGRGRTKVEHLRDSAVLDLKEGRWISKVRDMGRTVGAYRSAVAGEQATFVPRSKTADRIEPSHSTTETGSGSFLFYSNSDLKAEKIRRDLDLLGSNSDARLTSLSHIVSSRKLPPGLRFPSSFVLGRFLVVTGVQIDSATASASVGVWALDLVGGLSSLEDSTARLRWKELDGGRMIQKGSWGKGMRWKNKLVLVGDGEGDLAKDYARRQQSFSDILSIDLEAFGVYQPPARLLEPADQQLGLQRLEPSTTSDTYTVLTTDQRRLKCSRRLLTHRWRWLGEQLDSLVMSDPDSDIQDSVSASLCARRRPSIKSGSLSVTPTGVHVPLNAPSALALLHYFATLTLCTPLQHTLPVLRALLLFSSGEADLKHLRSLVIHALHDGLDDGTFAPAQVYEVAALGGRSGYACLALQVRTLQGIMKDVGEPTNSTARKHLSILTISTALAPPTLTTFDAPASPPASILSVDSSVKAQLSIPRAPRRGSATSTTSSLSVDRRYSPRRNDSLPVTYERDPPSPSPLGAQGLPTSPGWPPVINEGEENRPPRSRTASLPTPPQNRRPSKAPSLPTSPLTLLDTTTSSLSSPMPSPLSPLPVSVLQPSVHSTKTLTLAIKPPSSGAHAPGSTINLTFTPLSPATSTAAFTAISVRLVGTSAVAHAGVLPSLHPILTISEDADLSQEVAQLKMEIALPEQVSCPCRTPKCELSPSGKVTLEGIGVSAFGVREGDSTLEVEYKLEVNIRRKGWSKGAEKLLIPYPFPIRPRHPFGASLPSSGTLNSALASAQGVSTSWPKTPFAAHDLLPISASSAELSHARTILPSAILLAWNLTVRLPHRDATALAKLISSGGLSVYAGRRIVASFDIRGDGGIAKTTRIDAKSSAKRPATIDPPEGDSDLATLNVGGWLELGQEQMRTFVTCNGHLRHVVVVSIPSLRDLNPLLLEVDLNPTPTSSATPSFARRPSSLQSSRSSIVEASSDSLAPRPKRLNPPSISSTGSGEKKLSGFNRVQTVDHHVAAASYLSMLG